MPAVAWQRAEGALVFVAALGMVWLGDLPFAWWLALVLFFAPDLTFAGYLAGPRIGALFYNAAHVYGFGLVVAAAGMALGMPTVLTAGFLWLAHSGFDRMLGYGLKLPAGFSETHLGRIGRGG